MSAMPFPVDRKVQSAIDRLMRAETPFAVATVIRTLDATGAKPGARALLDRTGAVVEGWIGGGCARAAVARAVREAIEAGQPRLISLRPEELLQADASPRARNAVASGSPATAVPERARWTSSSSP